MAAPVAHIFCALALLQSGALEIKDHKAFIIGTSFPDIRYLAKLPRNNTHNRKVTWQEVQNASSDFEAGMLFHSLVDEARIKQIEIKYNNKIPYVPAMRCYMLKLFEDILLFDRVNNWKKVLSYFDEVLQEERDFGIPENKLREWHQFIQRYCSKKVSPSHMQYIIETTPHFSLNMPKLPAIISKTYTALVFYRFNKKSLINVLNHFYNNIIFYTQTHALSSTPAQATSAAPVAVAAGAIAN